MNQTTPATDNRRLIWHSERLMREAIAPLLKQANPTGLQRLAYLAFLRRIARLCRRYGGKTLANETRLLIMLAARKGLNSDLLYRFVRQLGITSI